MRAFPYALFGNIEGLTKSRLVNWRNKKNLEVIINFSKKDIKYVLTRGIKPDVLSITENGIPLPVPPNKKDFQKQIENDILEMDYDTFMRVIYADTNNSDSILTLNKPQKREFLEQIFNLEYYTKLKDAANKKISSITQQITSLEQQIENNKKHKDDLVKQKYDYNNTLKNLKDSTPELNDIIKQYEEKIKQHDEQKEKLEKIQEQIKEKENYISLQKLILSKIDSKIKNLSTRYINKTIVVINDKEINNKIKELENKNKELSGSIVKVKEFSPEEIKYNKEQKKHFEKAVIILKNNIKNFNEELNKDELKNVNICPTCMQQIDHKFIKDYYVNGIKDAAEMLQENEKELKKWTDKLTEIEENEKQQNENNKIQMKILQNESEISKLNDKLKEINEVKKAQQNKEKYIKVVGKLNGCKESIVLELELLNDNLSEVKLTKNSVENYFTETDKLKNEVEKFKDRVIYEKQEKERIENWIKETKNKIENLMKEVDKDSEQIVKFKNIKEYFIVIKDITSDNEAKQYTISNKVPLLNKKVNQYLSKAGVNYYVKLDGWLEPEIKGPGIHDCSYENLSGAERVNIDRALQFAFNDISKLQSPIHMNLMIFDELLDSSMDQKGLQDLMKIVRIKQQEDDLNVLIVSHRSDALEDLEDYFDNKYIVEFTKGFSYIKKL